MNSLPGHNSIILHNSRCRDRNTSLCVALQFDYQPFERSAQYSKAIWDFPFDWKNVQNHACTEPTFLGRLGLDYKLWLSLKTLQAEWVSTCWSQNLACHLQSQARAVLSYACIQQLRMFITKAGVLMCGTACLATILMQFLFSSNLHSIASYKCGCVFQMHRFSQQELKNHLVAQLNNATARV